MIEIRYTGDALWARIERAVEIVKNRLRRVTEALNAASIPYAVMQDAKTLPFESLVRMKLTWFRRKDQVHLQDMISIGLLNESWLDRLSPDLQVRLQELLDDPDG